MVCTVCQLGITKLLDVFSFTYILLNSNFNNVSFHDILHSFIQSMCWLISPPWFLRQPSLVVYMVVEISHYQAHCSSQWQTQRKL